MKLKETFKWLLNKGLYLLKTPSSFKDDKIKMFWNQIGHGLGFGTLFTILFGFVPGLVIYALIETSQYLFFKGELWDCVRDFGFYLTFASFVLTGNILFLAVYTAFLASDYFERA